jgi:cyanobactin maturation PatA/PatG family protease
VASAIVPTVASLPPSTAPPPTEQAPNAAAGLTNVAPSSSVPGGPPCSCGTRPSGDAPAPPAAAAAPAVTRVFAIGNIGFDFGTEARRDTFRQLMPRVSREPQTSPPTLDAPNPYDTAQLADYLQNHPYDSTKLIWTFNLDLTPVYAIEAEVTYHEYVYDKLRTALRNQSLPADNDDFISRVSLPGVLTDRTVRLFSGQVVPVVVAQPRGMYLWSEKSLVDAAVAAVNPEQIGASEPRVRLKLRQMLDKVYYQLRNLGTASPDRAINFMATNAFVFTQGIANGLTSGKLVDGDDTNLYSLNTISAVKSPYCRIDSDCWDVQLTFFDPENENRAQAVFQTTVDVSDELPVQLAPTHQFLFAG